MANFHMAEARNKNIPLNGTKFIFSVDLVHCVIVTKWSDFPSDLLGLDNAWSYRDFVYHGFVGEIKDAAVFLANRHWDDIKRRFEEYMQNNNELTVDSFKAFNDELKALYFLSDNEHNKRNLLKYFVSIALLAGHYYYKGITNAPEIAVNFCTMTMPEAQFVNSDFWDELTKICRQILGTDNEEPVPEPKNLNLIEYQEH